MIFQRTMVTFPCYLWLMQFSDITGQQAVKQRLLRSIREGRVSHAQLFLGQEGSGSLPLAVAYAQMLLCKNKKDNDSCGVCPSCQKSSKLIHPDIHFVYPLALSKEVKKSTDVAVEWREAFLANPYLNLHDWFGHLDAENKQPVIGVEESAEVLRKLSLTTYEGEFKILIIWMPEKMNVQASNKLLKILEEPADKTLFFLVSEDEEALLRTIVSRTQLVKITRIPDQEIKQVLVRHHHLSEDEADHIAYIAEGNLNKARRMISEDNRISSCLTPFREWMRMCYSMKIQEMLSWVEEISSSKTGREKQKELLTYGLNILRECLALMYGDPSLVRAGGEELDFIRRFSSPLNGNTLHQITEELNLAILHIERNGSARIIFTDLTLKIMNIFQKLKSQKATVNPS